MSQASQVTFKPECSKAAGGGYRARVVIRNSRGHLTSRVSQGQPYASAEMARLAARDAISRTVASMRRDYPNFPLAMA